MRTTPIHNPPSRASHHAGWTGVWFKHLRASICCRPVSKDVVRGAEGTRLRRLLAQGLCHASCVVPSLLVAPSAFALHSLAPRASHVLAAVFVKWIGLRDIRAMDNLFYWAIISSTVFWNLSCLFFLAMCTFTDPGRIPAGYHWVATLATIGKPKSGETVAYHCQYPDSSYCPQLHRGEIRANPTDGIQTIYLPQNAVNMYAEALNNSGGDRNRMTPMEIRGILNDMPVRLKWCDICKHIRHPRTRHCLNCNACVDRFDHHCVWICNCVGLRNQRYFLAFVSCACGLEIHFLMLSLFILKGTWDALATADRSPGPGAIVLAWCSHLAKTCVAEPGSCILLLVDLLLFVPVLNLMLFHMVLILTNRTTTEEMRELYMNNNPFFLGWRENCRYILCAEPPVSLTDRMGRRRARLESKESFIRQLSRLRDGSTASSATRDLTAALIDDSEP